MTSYETEKVLQETRRRIEGNLERLAHLSGSAMEVQPYFQELLQIAGESLGARGGAVWMREGTAVKMVAALSYESSGAKEGNRQAQDIGALVRKCLSENRALVVMPGDGELSSDQSEPGNSIAHPFFYIPVLLENHPVAVLQLWLQQAGDAAHYKDFVAFLGTIAGHASNYLQHCLSARSRTLASSWQMQVNFHQDLLACHSTQEVLEVAAHHMADLAGAELGFVCHRSRNNWKLVAASNADKVIPASSQALLLAAAVASLPKDKFVVLDAISSTTPEPVQQALEQCGASLLLGIFPLEKKELQSPKTSPPKIFIGALRQSRTPPSADVVNTVSLAAEATARLFHERELREALPLSELSHAAARLRLLWQEHPRRLLFSGSAIAATLLVILLLPWPWRISADCTVMPATRLAAVAGIDGKVLAIYAGEGDFVRKGQTLARLDDRDLQAQLAAVEQSRERWQVEEAHAQTLGNDAERKEAKLNSLKEEENLKLLKYRLERTAITSPISGIVLTRELRNHEGENMEAGKILCEVADPTAYLLELQIKQQDLGEVQQALSTGKPLRIDFILYAHAENHLHAEVQGLRALSPAAELAAKGSYFTLRTKFPGRELSLADLKTGYTGKAKLTLGRRPLWRILFTPFLNYMNVEWGT